MPGRGLRTVVLNATRSILALSPPGLAWTRARCGPTFSEKMGFLGPRGRPKNASESPLLPNLALLPKFAPPITSEIALGAPPSVSQSEIDTLEQLGTRFFGWAKAVRWRGSMSQTKTRFPCALGHAAPAGLPRALPASLKIHQNSSGAPPDRRAGPSALPVAPDAPLPPLPSPPLRTTSDGSPDLPPPPLVTPHCYSASRHVILRVPGHALNGLADTATVSHHH